MNEAIRASGSIRCPDTEHRARNVNYNLVSALSLDAEGANGESIGDTLAGREGLDPESFLIERRPLAELSRAINELSDSEVAVIRARLADISSRESAERFGKSQQWVQKKEEAARMKLAERLIHSGAVRDYLDR